MNKKNLASPRGLCYPPPHVLLPWRANVSQTGHVTGAHLWCCLHPCWSCLWLIHVCPNQPELLLCLLCVYIHLANKKVHSAWDIYPANLHLKTICVAKQPYASCSCFGSAEFQVLMKSTEFQTALSQWCSLHQLRQPFCKEAKFKTYHLERCFWKLLLQAAGTVD